MFCAACSAFSAASNAGFTVDRFSTDEGLPQSAVLAVTQTRDGYLWVGTLNGLARFDGVHFTVFDENNTPGLTSGQIVHLFEDSHTNLWIGTENGGVMLAKDGKISSLNLGRGGREARLMATCEDANGTVWLYTANGLLCRYRDGKVDTWHAGSDAPSNCRALISEASGLLWVGTDTSLAALGPIPPVASPALTVAYEMGLIRLNFLLASKQGGYWRLANGHIQKCKGDRVERDLGPYPWPDTSPVVAACEDREGNLAVGTYGDGVYWFDAQGKVAHISSAQGLSHSYVLSMTVDREGCLWIGTNGGGLNRVKRHVFDVLECTSGSVVQTVCEGAEEGLWIGFTGNRVDHWSGSVTQRFQLIPGAFLDINPNTLLDVKALFIARNQRVVAGTWSAQGPHLFQFVDGSFQPVALPETFDRNISAIYQDRSGQLYLGTQGGLLCWDEKRWKRISSHEGLSADDVRAIAEDKEGNLWVGTEGGGLNRLRDGRTALFTKTNGLPGNNVSSLFVDGDGVLWIGTSSGLARFQRGKWTRYSKKDGLASNNVGYILEDGHGYFWLGSSAGLMRVKKQALNDFADGRTTFVPCRAYGKPDGLPAGECTFGSQPGALRARDGELWFPTIGGLGSLNPAHLVLNSNPPPVIIEAVLVDGQPQGPALLRSPPPRQVTVPAGKEAIEIKYASLDLASPEKGRFKYRLEPHETAWTEVEGNIRAVHYSKLPHGHYVFRVTACNEDEIWNDAGSELAVTVLPPFWQTWWFIGGASLCLLGLIVASVHYVSTQRLQRQLESLRQHEALEKERARIARDIHDQVGASLTQVSLLGEQVEMDKHNPEEIEKHARQISQTALETTRAFDEIVWTVNPSNDTLDGLLTYICKYAQDYLAVAGLRYRLEVPAQLPAIPISPELRHNIFLAAKEAVTNVVRHARASSVWIRLILETTRFTLEIQDDGCGLADLDPKAAQTRNGLRNMHKRMENIGGEFSMKPGAENGTVVRLMAPLKAWAPTGKQPH